MLFALAACSSQAGPALTFDPCQPTAITATGATADQLASIDDAIAMWQAERVSLVRSDTGPIAIEFRDASATIYGFYDDATAMIYINNDLADRSPRAIAVAHELGHALGLVHVPPATRASVMNPGNLAIAPDDGDAAALAAVWGDCPAR